jgi:hypothetical protein
MTTGGQDNAASRITLRLRRIAAFLVIGWLLIVAAGFLAEYARYIVGSKSQVVDYFSLSEEQNVPTWWSSSMLLACSVALAAITATKTRARGDRKTHWAVLSVIFCYMSLDELVEIHERLNDIPALSQHHGALYYGWIIPASVIVLVFAVSYLKFLFHLPMKTRVKVALAGALYVGGALGVEVPLGLWQERHGELNFGWAIIDMAEEAMEIAGSSLFLYALLEYLGRTHPDLRIALTPEHDTKAAS